MRVSSDYTLVPFWGLLIVFTIVQQIWSEPSAVQEFPENPVLQEKVNQILFTFNQDTFSSRKILQLLQRHWGSSFQFPEHFTAFSWGTMPGPYKKSSL